MKHWYVAPASMCQDCGKPDNDPSHFVRCDSVWSFGPGFAFCELYRGHDEAHRLRNWNGALYLAYRDGTTELIEDAKPLGWVAG